MAERNRGKQLRSDSCDSGDRTRGCGGFGGGGKNSGGCDDYHRRGCDSGGRGGGGTSGVGVAQGAAEEATLVATTGAVVPALAEAKEGRGMAARGLSAWDGSSTSSRPSSASSTDHGEVTVVAGNK